jgi:arsenate reductase
VVFSYLVIDVLPQMQLGAFAKEDGELVMDASGQRIA